MPLGSKGTVCSQAPGGMEKHASSKLRAWPCGGTVSREVLTWATGGLRRFRSPRVVGNACEGRSFLIYLPGMPLALLGHATLPLVLGYGSPLPQRTQCPKEPSALCKERLQPMSCVLGPAVPPLPQRTWGLKEPLAPCKERLQKMSCVLGPAVPHPCLREPGALRSPRPCARRSRTDELSAGPLVPHP